MSRVRFIVVSGAKSCRIFIRKLEVNGHEFLTEATYVQDDTLIYQEEVWVGYLLLPGTKEYLVKLFEILFDAEDVTKEFIRDIPKREEII